MDRAHHASSWRVAPALLALLASIGCYDWRSAVAHTAAFEHHCPDSDVHILGDSGDGASRSVELEVCGVHRSYRDVGGRRAYVWVDQSSTLGTGSMADDDATRIYAARGRGSFVRSTNGAVLVCTQDAPIDLTLAVDDDGTVTLTPPSVDDRTLFCLRNVMRGVRAPADVRRVSFVAHYGSAPSATDPASAVSAPPAPPTSPTSASSDEFANAVRAQLDRNAARVLACTGGPAIAIVAEWGTSGAVRFTASGSSDASVNECVAVAAGALDVPTGSVAGRLLHPLGR